MAYHHSGKAPVCAINSDGGLERTRLVANNGGEADRQMVQSDDRRDNGEDFGQSGFPESEVPMRVSVPGWSIRSPVTERREPVLSRAFQFWSSEEHTSELKPLMRISYAVFCLKQIL